MNLKEIKPYLKVYSFGGVSASVIQCVEKRMHTSKLDWHVNWDPAGGTIDMQRAAWTEAFLGSGCNVFFQLDHDIIFGAGDLDHVVIEAYKREAVVAGVYAKRAFGQGIASAFLDGKYHELGSDEIFELSNDRYVATGFMAVHLQVFHDMMCLRMPAYMADGTIQVIDIPRVVSGFFPFYVPAIKEIVWGDKPEERGFQYLTEDYVFCHRAREAGRKVFATMKPILGHEGKCVYTANEGNQAGPVPYKRTVVL